MIDSSTIEEALCRSYRLQANLYDRALAISQRLLACDDLAGIQPLLAELREVMDSARRLDNEVRDARQRWQDADCKPGPPLAAALKDVQVRLEPLIANVQAAEQKASEARARMVPQLSTQARGRKMQAAYAQQS